MEIALQNITKDYGSVRANDHVTMRVVPGSIHGLLGENGAGKSTLMKILSGYTPKTDGEIRIDRGIVEYESPAHAAGLGIGMLYQDPLDFPLLSVLENFKLGQSSSDMTALRIRLTDLCRRFGFTLDPDAPLASLTIGERQQLEILRLLEKGIRTLILDEPTTGISGTQKAALFSALKQLADEGRSVILVSHKLEDVEALCDRVTVLRGGKGAGEMDSPFDPDQLMTLMFGTRPKPPPRSAEAPGGPVLNFTSIHARGGRTGLKSCSVLIRENEVVGLAGLEGSGQGVFLRTAAGLIPPLSGEIHLKGQPMKRQNHHGFKRKGVNFLPSGRLEEGLIPGLTLAEHSALQNGGGFWVRWPGAIADAARRITNFRIKGEPNLSVESLSGGNQQRLLLSFLSENPTLLLLENPTRGLDVESANWVWEHLHRFCAKGAAIVFASSELDEILAQADRVMVFFNGAVIKDVRTQETDLRELGLAIAGRA